MAIPWLSGDRELTRISRRDETGLVSEAELAGVGSGRGGQRASLRCLALALLLLVGFGRTAEARAAAHFRIAPAPTWPTTSEPARAMPPPLGDAAEASGEHVQLFAHEVRAAARMDAFWHLTRRITGQAGLQANSQLNVEFDPSYQTLVFHYVVILRADQRINALKANAIKLAQRQSGLESQIFDSRESAIIFLEDLRVGDVVDYAYSLEGSDPTLAGRVDDSFLLGLSVPVDHLVARLLTDKDRELSVSLHGPALADGAAFTPRINHDATDYRWDLWATKPYPSEADVPKAFDAFPFATLSQFKSWRDVAIWGKRFFPLAAPLGGPAQAWVAQRKNPQNAADFALETARFVQDEIRYVGMEVGMARRQASDPSLTFERRYGDCKDKTLLLVALLRAGGVEAMPALVSSTRGALMDESAASGSVFDHAIVRLTIAGRHLFIDPTNAMQGGGIERFQYSTFGRALVLSEASNSLEALPLEPATEPTLSILDRLHLNLPSSPAEATLDTVRTYRGWMADNMRAQLRSISAEQRSKTYLAIYQPDYPDIHELGPIEQSDDRIHDLLKVTAHFAIPSIWTARQAGRTDVVVSARALHWLLPRPSSNARAVPLGTSFPAFGRQVIEIDLPFDLPQLSSKPERLRTSSTSFSFESSYANRRLTYRYDIAVRAPAVALAEMQAQTRMADQALTLMQRTVLYREALAENGWHTVNWLMALLALFVFSGSVVLSWRAFRAQKSIANTRRERGPPLPLGGVLWLLAMGVLSLPVATAIGCVQDLRILLSLPRWQAMTTPGLETYRPGLAALLLAGLAFRLTAFSYSFTVAGTLLKKRRSFPWHFTVLTVAWAIFSIAETIAASSISNESASAAFPTEATRAIVSSVIWISYLRSSPRVARTFTNGRRKPAKRSRRTEHELTRGVEPADSDEGSGGDAKC